MLNFHVHSLRTLVHDQHHNAFTGARWFQDNLYVAYRQGDAHVCQQGKIIVRRSRDQGLSFDHAAVIRGQYSTRDAHLYHCQNKRLFATGWEVPPPKPGTTIRLHPGCAYTDDGLSWSPWTRYAGTPGIQDWIMWRPEFFGSKHYCIGYDYTKPGYSRIGWFESDNGIDWDFMHVIHEGSDQPNEVFIEFQPDGSVIGLCRREHQSRKPLLLKSKPPYTHWEKTELDVALQGPCLWTVDEHIYISGRWSPNSHVTHTAIFHVVDNKPELMLVLPSGPEFDHSYMSVARWPNNSHRLTLPYYSNHQAHADPRISQWKRPGIYVVDISFEAQYITNWHRSHLITNLAGLTSVNCPDPGDASLAWTPIQAIAQDQTGAGMVDEHEFIAGRTGILFFDTTIDIGPCDHGALQLGYDGPVKVWVNGIEVFAGPGTNPAIPNTTSVPVKTTHGPNRITIALDTNCGKAWGFFASFEPKA